MKCDYHICGKGFIGCPGDATEYARRLEQLWDELPVSGAKPTLYHWHKHYDPYAGTAAVGSQYRIERTGNPSVNPVFILFAQTIGTPVRPPPEGWRKLRAWLDGNGWNFVVLLGETRYPNADAVPHGTIPLTGTMFELFDALQAGQETHLVIYDLSRLTEPPNPDTPEHQRQRAWREQLIYELGKTYAVKDRAPQTREEFEQRALKDLKEAFDLPALDPLYGTLPSLAAVGVDEPLLFGRDELIESLSRRIMERGAAFTRVLGVSGAGKSSLLRAGLMGSWFDRSRGKAGLLAKATALLIEPLQLWALDPDPLKALSLLLTGALADRDTGAVGPYPKAITATSSDLPMTSGDRVADLVAARAWWNELVAAVNGPIVLIIDQAEQVDVQAKREARDRIDRNSDADPTLFLSPTWRRFVDLITSLAGVADPALDAPPNSNESSYFRLVLGLHRNSAIDLWACDKARILANPPIEVPPLTEWRMVIQNTIEMYGLELDEALLASIATEAERLTNERQPVHTNEEIDDDTRYDRASVLPLVKVALWRLIMAWRQRINLDATTELRKADKTLELSRFGPVSGIADSVDELGEAAIELWARTLSGSGEVRGLFEQEAFARECSHRFDHLFMGLIDVGEKGRTELNYIQRDGRIARDEELLLSALGIAGLVTGPDAEHWRLSHRAVIANWERGRDFIVRHEVRLATKRRLVLSYQSGVPVANWGEQDIAPFIELAIGWIGNDEGEDTEFYDYLRSGLTSRFRPERFGFNTNDALDHLPLEVLTSGRGDWADRLFERALEDQSWNRTGDLWTLVAAVFGRQVWLGRIFALTSPPLARHFANRVDLNLGTFPLLMAAQQGHADCVSLLLHNGARPNQINGKNATFPLLMAAQNGHADCVSLLLNYGAEPNQINGGTFPLLMAAQQGHADCVSLLLHNGANPNQINGKNATFPLFMAAQNGHADCVSLLLHNGAQPNQINNEIGTFPLFMAAQQGHADCVSLLLHNGAEPNQINGKNATFPLLTAARNGHADCVSLLLDNGAKPNQIEDQDGTFPLLMAAWQGHADCVSLLLDNGAKPNQIEEPDGTFPLLMAAQSGHADCVSLLLDNGAKPNQINDQDGAFPLLMAAQNGHADCVGLLLNNGAEPNQTRDKTGTFPLLMAALNGYASCVGLLLENGANPNQPHAADGVFPLLMATQNGHADCISLLLDNGAEPNQIRDKTGTFPLLMAVERGRAECVSLLLHNGSKPNQINDITGTFPMFTAAQNGYADSVSLLLDNGAEPNQVNDKTGTFPLFMAAQNGYADCVSLLLDNGAEPNQINDQDGTFPLLMAGERGHADCVSLLLVNGADPNQIDNEDSTFPLFMAAQQGHADCVSLLLDNGAEPNQIHVPSGATALMLALGEGHWSVVRILGQRPAALDHVPAEVHRFLKEIIAHPELQPQASAHEPPPTRRSGEGIQLPVSPGSPVNPVQRRDRTPPIWYTLGLRPEAIDPASVRREDWRLNAWDDALISARFCLTDPQLELQALVFDLPLSERLVPCIPGFDFSALAHSLRNAGRPLMLGHSGAAFLWASLLVTYQYGGTPILPESPWPLVSGSILPLTLYPEEFWRRWELAQTALGPTVTLPFLRGGELLSARILIPQDGIGAELAGHPEIIMSGLDFPVPRFVSSSKDGSLTGLWCVREIERDQCG